MIKNLSFYLLLISNFMANLGDSLYIISAVTLVYQITDSATLAAMIPILRVTAQVFSGMITPFIIGKFRLKYILINSQLIQILLFTCLTIVRNDPVNILVLVFLISFLDGWVRPCKNSLVPRLVTEEQIVRANSLLSSSNQVVQIIGWSLGGLLIVYIGDLSVLLITTSLYVLSTLSIFFIKDPVNDIISTENKESKWKRFTLGWRNIWENKILRVVTIMDVFETFSGSIWVGAIILIYVKEVLQKSEEWWGFINASNIVGMMIGGVIAWFLAKWIDKKLILSLFSSSLSVCILTFLFALNINPLISIGIVILMGIPYQLRDITQQTIFQKNVEYSILPIILSAHSILTYSVFGLSVLFMGLISDIFGVKIVYFIAGTFYGISALLTILLKTKVNVQNDIKIKGTI